MSTTPTPPTIRTADQRIILHRYARGEDIDQIAAVAGLGRDLVSKTITDLAGFDRGRARAAVLAYDAAQQALAQKTSEPADTINELLLAAERSKLPRAEKLAGRIRGQLADLDALLRDSETERILRATMVVLREHLDRTAEELRDLKTGTRPAPRSAMPAAVSTAMTGRQRIQAIREWAHREKVDCPKKGRIPASVEAAWEAAQVGGAG